MNKLYNVEVGISYSDALRAIEHFAEEGDFERLGLDVAERLARAALKMREAVSKNRVPKEAKDTLTFWNTVNEISRGHFKYANISFTIDELDTSLEKGELTFMGRRIGYLDKVNQWTEAPKPNGVTLELCNKCGLFHQKNMPCSSATIWAYATCPFCHLQYTGYHDCKGGVNSPNITTTSGRTDSSKENTSNTPKVGYGG